LHTPHCAKRFILENVHFAMLTGKKRAGLRALFYALKCMRMPLSALTCIVAFAIFSPVMAKQESTSIRIPMEVYEKLKSASADLGDPGANWVGTRCLAEMMELAEENSETRRVPKIVRMIDGARTEGKPLLPGEPSRRPGQATERTQTHVGPRKISVKGGND
jgi:hypothetical protein